MMLHATRLPVSGLEVVFRQPNGEDDVLICEADGSAVHVALLLASRLAVRADGTAADWPALTVTDFDVLLLGLRAYLIGPQVECELHCPNPGCGERLEIPFRVDEYLADVRPRRPRDVEALVGRGEPWFQLAGSLFRLPTVGDRALVMGQPDALRRLAQRCIDPPELESALRLRIERAMSKLAPEVSRFVEGQCPYCKGPVRAFLDVAGFVVGEVRRATSHVYDEIHAIAHAYHWSEASIMQLPRQRRQRYVDRIRQHHDAVV